jgi:hemoglobin
LQLDTPHIAAFVAGEEAVWSISKGRRMAAVDNRRWKALAIALFALSTLSACLGGGTWKQRTLYERLGGKGALVAIVDDFGERLTSDARTRARFAEVDLNRFKPLLVAQLCQLSGGKCVYDGRGMQVAHQGRNIADRDFDAFLAVLTQSLDRFHIPDADIKELMASLVPMRKEIVR